MGLGGPWCLLSWGVMDRRGPLEQSLEPAWVLPAARCMGGVGWGAEPGWGDNGRSRRRAWSQGGWRLRLGPCAASVGRWSSIARETSGEVAAAGAGFVTAVS